MTVKSRSTIGWHRPINDRLHLHPTLIPAVLMQECDVIYPLIEA